MDQLKNNKTACRLSMIFFAIALGLCVIRIVLKLIIRRYDFSLEDIGYGLVSDISMFAATLLCFIGMLKQNKVKDNLLCPAGSIIMVFSFIINIMTELFYGGIFYSWALIIDFLWFNAAVLIVLDFFIRPRKKVIGIIGASLFFLCSVIIIFIELKIYLPYFQDNDKTFLVYILLESILYYSAIACYGIGALFYTIMRNPHSAAEKNGYQQPQQNYYPQNQPPQYQYNYNQNQYRQYQPPQPPQPENQPPQAAGQSGDELEKKLEKLKDLRDRQLITEEEYSEQVRRLLNDF